MICAALLHDAVEDHAGQLATAGEPQNALATLAEQFGEQAADLVAAVTNPLHEPGRDRHEQYREHVVANLEASPWARVIKASDFTDNGVGLIHTTGPGLNRLADKYAPLVPALADLIARSDTRLSDDAKDAYLASSTAPGRGSQQLGQPQTSARRPDELCPGVTCAGTQARQPCVSQADCTARSDDA